MQVVDQHSKFGLKLCGARFVIECSFGRLKARFGILRRPLDINLEDVPHVVYACFVLHNFCEMCGDSINDDTVTQENISSFQVGKSIGNSKFPNAKYQLGKGEH